MADNTRFTVKIEDNTKEAKKALEDAIEKILTELGMDMEKNAILEITDKGAIDTGLLKNSITWAIGGEGAEKTTYKADRGDGSGQYSGTAEKRECPCVYVGTNVEYAQFVELGTSTMPPRPFIKTALTDYKDEYKKIVEKYLKNS